MRYWTTVEMQALRQLYPGLGPRGIQSHLPGRSIDSIQTQASIHGIRFLGRRHTRKRKYPRTEQIDEAIRRVYQTKPVNGSVKALAQHIGYPHWWVKKRAQALGLSRPARKDPPWSDEEEALLRRYHSHSLDVIRRKLAEHGYARSGTAIVLRRKRLELSPRDDGHYTACEVAKLLGVTSKTVPYWIRCDWLDAERRGTERTAVQGGDMWWIKHTVLRRFIIQNPHLIDLRKITDTDWFISMLAGNPPDGRQHRRKRPRAAA